MADDPRTPSGKEGKRALTRREMEQRERERRELESARKRPHADPNESRPNKTQKVYHHSGNHPAMKEGPEDGETEEVPATDEQNKMYEDRLGSAENDLAKLRTKLIAEGKFDAKLKGVGVRLIDQGTAESKAKTAGYLGLKNTQQLVAMFQLPKTAELLNETYELSEVSNSTRGDVLSRKEVSAGTFDIADPQSA
jgi:hypothetical protein